MIREFGLATNCNNIHTHLGQATAETTMNRKGGNKKGAGGAVRSQNNRQSRLDAPYSVKKSDDHEERSNPPTNFRITINNSAADHNDDSMTTEEKVGSKRPSVLSRLGDTAAAPSNKISGTYVVFENLHPKIIADDIKDLCESVGDSVEIKSVLMISIPGSSTKSAEAVFARRSQALECIKKYHNVKLDGVTMSIKLKGEDGKDNPFNPFDLSASSSADQGNNVRVGLFGTAMNGNKPSHQVHPVVSRNVRLEQTVSFSHDHRGQTHVSRGRGDNRHAQGSRNPPQQRRGNASSHHEKRKPVDESSLDAELDNYMKK